MKIWMAALFRHKANIRHRTFKWSAGASILFRPGGTAFLPTRSVDLLFSTTALHYASKCAAKLSGHVLPLYPTGSDETTAWASLSEADLHTAMSNIHGCLRPGGNFWAVVPGHSRNESTGKIKNYWYREVLEVMCEQLRSLVKTGVVDEATWNNFVLPVHQRHQNQWRAWFARNDSMFHLEFLYGEDQTNPYLQRFRYDHKDPDRFADEYLSSVRAWSDKIITQVLPDLEPQNEFFEGLRRQFIKQDPERLHFLRSRHPKNGDAIVIGGYRLVRIQSRQASPQAADDGQV